MLMAGGPIERIYSKIVDCDSGNNEDTIALFDVDDFTMDYDFNIKLKNNASKKAVKMANKLLPETDGSYEDDECNPEIVTSYMNSKVEQVIRSCAGIEPGDFQQIFKEIRQELFRQGKNLFLLIEDITSCTGINKDLLEALAVKHTGINEADNMCRLVSVIGTTTEYFKEFRDNYIDRITTKITIEDGSIGNNVDDLIQFVAKYLNIMSISVDEIDNWYRDGALESEYPVHVDPDIKKWESYNFNGKSLSLYPFTKRAIINLYNGLEQHKTPRYILRKIIEPAVDNILQDRQCFPKFLKSKSAGLNFDVEARIKSTLANMQINTEEKDDYRDRVFSVIGFWGDGTLSIKNNSSIGTVSASIFKEFNLEKFAEKVLGVSIGDSDIPDPIDDLIISPVDSPIIDPPKPNPPETNKKFDDFARILSDWHYEGKSFTKAFEVRDEICKFIFASIAWQREGVSLLSVQMVEESSYNLISIERQDKAIDKGLILLEDSDDTYQLLLAFGKWLYIGKKSWNFNNATSSIRFVTSWLEKNKSKFIDIVKDYDDKTKYPECVRCAIIAEIYRGIINGDYQISKISDIKAEILLKSQSERIKKNSIGHSLEWIELQENILYKNRKAEENIELIQRYYNLIQGNVKNSPKKIINYTSLESTFKEVKKNCFEINVEEFTIDKIKDRNTSKDYLKKIIVRLEKVVKAESKEGKECYKEVLNYFGFSEGVEIEVEDIKDLLNEIIEFYKDAEINRINITPRTNEASNIKEQSNSIVKALDILNMDLSEKSLLEIIILYSQNPMKIVKQFIKLLEAVNADKEKVYLEMQKEKEALTRSGNWSDDVDPRFKSEKASFDELLKLVEV